MSDEDRPHEQAPEPTYDERPAPDAHAQDEPTEPLSGWSPQPSREATPEPTPGVQPDGRAYGERATPSSRLHPQQPASPEQAPPTIPFAPSGPVAGQGAQGPQGPQGPGPASFGPAPGPYPGPGYGQQQGHPQPGYGQGQGYAQPYAQPGYGRPGSGQHAGTGRSRRLPLWVWPSVAILALLVGLLGGLAGGALQDELASQRGTVDDGLAGVSTQSAAPLDAENGSIAAVAQALLPSTVQIVAEFDGRVAGATGSGFVLDREGHVVTNNHVVASAAADDGPIVVIDQAGVRHDATVVGRSSVYDLAVLAVEGPDGLEPAALGASQVLRVGDGVVAFGAPLGLSQTVTSGIVSALDRPVTTSGESEDESSYINAVQTDAAINPGNSGGPLVNLAGEVVGVNSAIATTGGASGESGNIGVGFAIPIEQVRTTVDQILRTGRAKYPVIGAQVRTGGEPEAIGATITEVMSGTPAERAGLEKDDLITAVDDQLVTDGISLIVAIRTHLPGETVEMTVRRGADEQVVEVQLDGKVG